MGAVFASCRRVRDFIIISTLVLLYVRAPLRYVLQKNVSQYFVRLVRNFH